jgi:hypothetical protein
MIRRVALVRTYVSEEPSASFIRVTRISELGTTLAATSNQCMLWRNTKSVLTRATWRNIPEDAILHSHRRENLKSYMMFAVLCSSSAVMFSHCSYKTNLVLCKFLYCTEFLFMSCRRCDLLCGLVVRVPGCRPRGPGCDSRRCQIFWVAVGLKRGPLSPCEDKWGATWKKSSGSSLENWG